jgi:D-xylose transport system permease protein
MENLKGAEKSATKSATAARAGTGQATNWRKLLGLQEMGVYYALALLIATLTVATASIGQTNYLSIQNMSNVIYQTSLIGMMAVAMTVVLISGNFDLSVASVAAFSAVVLVANATTLGFWPAAALAMGAAVLLGLVNGAIVQFVGINAFIVTLGTMTAVRGLILLYTDGRSVSVSEPDVAAIMTAFEGGKHEGFWVILALAIGMLGYGIYTAVRSIAARNPVLPISIGLSLGGLFLLFIAWASGGSLPVRNPVIYMAVFTGAVWFTLSFTKIGRRIYAVGGNSEAARLSGINVTKYRLMAFVFCSATAGFAGILFASRLRSMNPSGLQGAELTVIAAAILGGTSLFGGAGSVVKTLAGALLLYSLTNGFNILNLGANWQGLIEGCVVVAAAAIYTIGDKRSKSKTGG